MASGSRRSVGRRSASTATPLTLRDEVPSPRGAAAASRFESGQLPVDERLVTYNDGAELRRGGDVLSERSELRSELRLATNLTVATDVRESVVTITRADSEIVATAMSARFDDPRVEAEREAVLGEVIHAARELHQGMREQTLHALAEYRGSHSAWDVATEAGLVYAALDQYSMTMRRAAARLRPLLAR